MQLSVEHDNSHSLCLYMHTLARYATPVDAGVIYGIKLDSSFITTLKVKPRGETPDYHTHMSGALKFNCSMSFSLIFKFYMRVKLFKKYTVSRSYPPAQTPW